jgi:hypothetical protein
MTSNDRIEITSKRVRCADARAIYAQCLMPKGIAMVPKVVTSSRDGIEVYSPATLEVCLPEASKTGPSHVTSK